MNKKNFISKLKVASRYVGVVVAVVFTWNLVMSHRKPSVASLEALLAKRVKALTPSVDRRLKGHFSEKGIEYPPFHVTIVYIKDEKRLLLYAGKNGVETKLIKSYPVFASIGGMGPKLRSNDYQVPEGLYKLKQVSVTRHKKYILMSIDFPNVFDRKMAEEDGREVPTGDIFIHGTNTSNQGLAIGNRAIEELFVLAANGTTKELIFAFSATDLRKNRRIENSKNPPWINKLDLMLLQQFMVLED